MKNLNPAPRTVPLSALFNALFGGLYNQLGWGLLAFSLVFVWLFALDIVVADIQFSGTLTPSQAVIESVQETSSKENKIRIYRHIFRFEHQGKTFRAQSYATGQALTTGTAVPIEFKNEDPAVARMTLPGYRASLFGHMLLLVLIFPAVALLLIVQGLWRGFKIRQLLIKGQLAQATLSKKEATSATMKINGQQYPVYKLTFRFEVKGKSYQTLIQTHEVAQLLDDAEETMLYLPETPHVAFLLDAIPGKFSIQKGHFVCANPGKSLVLILLPLWDLGLLGLMILSQL